MSRWTVSSVEDDLAFVGVAGQAELGAAWRDLGARVVETPLVRIERVRLERVGRELNSFAAVSPERALGEPDRADRSGRRWGRPVAWRGGRGNDEIDVAGAVTGTANG
jgi:hypothetical protein